MAVMKCLLAMLILSVTVSCGNNSTERENQSLFFEKIAITGKGSDEMNAFCKDFSLTTRQAETFFEKSKQIDIKTFHDQYDYLPCYVTGTAVLEGNQCGWEIRAGGTAEIDCNGDSYILACSQCENLLRD
jgi:hypothetical protein